MMKNIVFVDIDDSIHDFSATCSLVALNEFGIRVDKTPEDWQSFILAEYDVCTSIFQRCHDRDYIFLSKPFPGSVEAVNKIADMGYDVRYLSDRKPESLGDTKDWLKENGFPNYDSLVVGRDKRIHMSKFEGKIAAVIDDRPRTMIFALLSGVPAVFSLRFSYNWGFTDVPGIYLSDEWPQILEDFESYHGGILEAGSPLTT